MKMWEIDQFGEAPAVIDEDGRIYSYSFLNEYGKRLADEVGGRKLVFCLCTNTIGSVLGYVTFINNSIVPVMLDANLNGEWLSGLTEIYRPDYIWRPSKSAEFGYVLEKTTYEKEFPLYDELALLLTTSGSTGSPKFVRQSYANIRANAESIVAYLKIDETERPITTLPMSYTYGLSIINSHLLAGASIILQKTLMRDTFWTHFRAFGATSFGGVPYTYEMLNRLSFLQMDLPSLHTMTQAGGRLSPELHRKFAEYARENDKKFIVMYGQSEATARMSYLPPEKSVENIGSIGVAIPGGELSLISSGGEVITGPDIVGELVYRGANVTLGYATRGEDLIRGDEREGVLMTGDMARRDDDGYYYITGRKKRFLKIFGNRVNLDEMELLMGEAFPTADIACSGDDDRMRIFTTDGGIRQELVKLLVDITGFNHSAFEVTEIDEIPHMASGKIRYGALDDL
jgi:acyl-coenzyme A synthetase/AMP-(fatty) acid ligase